MIITTASNPDCHLQDLAANDIADYQRWFSTDMEWCKWDAPWEETDEAFAHKYISRISDRLQKELPEVRTRFEIYYQNHHIGWVSSYFIEQDKTRLAVGISIPESGFWGKGIGREALQAWVKYLFEHNKSDYLYCETWSGNKRMVRLAHSIGFRIIDSDRTIVVSDGTYNRLRFQISAQDVKTSILDAT